MRVWKWQLGVIGLGVGLSLAGPASASCTDPPRPGVDWTRCIYAEREMTGVDLKGARLRDSKFTRSDLSNGTLAGIDGRRAKFVSSILRDADFTDAVLREADFTKADLTGANLSGSDLSKARLFRTILRGANLTGATMTGTDLWQADVSGATWTDGTTICAEGSVGQCR
ncbi:MAG: pentapeptide repeat-containing protein [Sphingomonadales bacterium]|nr:pentapeptide repeat-containing protein [Sphingomonadales bacterium]